MKNINEESDKLNVEENVSSSKEFYKNPNIKKNYFYNVLYQIFLLIVPLIVTPYISRVLLPDGIGKYSFSYSLITYFTMFGALGFGYYAQREVAKHRGNKYKQTKDFWEINICRLISVVISLVVNIILCVFKVYRDYNSLMWVFSINIIALAFDISFYFQGNENFKRLVLRNGIIKILSVVAIFVFVKDPGDLWIYTLINSSMVFISNLSMWIGIHKYIVKCKFKDLNPLKHFIGTLKLFIPTIATTIYTVLDRTLVGVLVPGEYTVIEDGVEIIKKYSDLENGYYEQSEKMVKLIMTLITSLGTVMIPRNSYEIAIGNLEQVKKNVLTSSRLVWFLGVPMVLGLMATANNFIPWFYGAGYEKCIKLIMVFSPLILIVGFSNIFGLQYMVPMGYDKKFSIALIIGSVVNFLLNIVLIIFYWSVGAAIASIIAESVITLLMAFMIRKEIKLKEIISVSIKYIVAGLLMFVVIFLLSNYVFDPSILNTIILVLIGMIIYIVILLILRDSMVISSLKKILKRNKKV